MLDLRLGPWETALYGEEFDALITDPPYSAQTHEGHARGIKGASDKADRADLHYGCFTEKDVRAFVADWSPRVRGWMVALTDSNLIPAWQSAYRAMGRYAFAPVPCVIRGMTVRLVGDGPSSWCVYAMVARPKSKEFSKWGTLPGAYTGGRGAERSQGAYPGGKPEWLMNALVRDYSRPGDTVVDPCAGYATTLVSCAEYGRHCTGAEVDRKTFDAAMARISRPLQQDLFA